MAGLSKGQIDALEAAFGHAVAYRQGLGDRPVGPRIDPLEATRRLGGALSEQGRGAVDVINAMVAEADAGLLQTASPRFFAYVAGASHPVGVAADLLCSAWGQISAYAATTPSVVAMENAVCDWVIGLLGLPEASGAGIVTGATMANSVAVMAARHALLRREGWDVEARGLYGAPEIAVVIGAEAHSATAAALRHAGLGAERVHRVATDDQGRMRADDLARVMAGLSGPILVILQAGHVNSGAFDPYSALITSARAKRAWVHVDGAFGLWLRAVPALAGRLAGVDGADSWAVDLHKWLNAPYDAGMVIVRDRSALVGAMSAHGDYLPERGAIANPSDSVPELARRARGVPSYAILQHLGRRGLREMIARHCRLAEDARAALSGIDGLCVMSEASSNQVAFRCGEGAAGDTATDAVLARVQGKGRVYPSHGIWRGRHIIRVSICGHATGEADVAALIADVGEAWAGVQREMETA